MQEITDSVPEADQVSGLYPGQVCAQVCTTVPPSFRLETSEQQGTGKMADRRLRTFRMGRYCARSAMLDLGQAGLPVARGAQGEPCWPEGITGSISHTESLGAAVVAFKRDYAGLGLDIEEDGELSPELFPQILLEGELDAFRQALGPGRSARLLFSIKESLFKCVWPSLRCWIDFTDMEIVPGLDEGSWQAVSRCGQVPDSITARLQGRWNVSRGYLLAGAWLAHG